MVHYLCQDCGETDPKRFGTRIVNGRIYPRHVCKSCWTGYTKQVRSAASTKRAHDRHKRKETTQRSLNINTGKYVLRDARGSDKKKGFTNDLDREFVDEMLRLPCIYCGEDSVRMTLDRIDNSLGHLKSNIVPACIRCNYARRNMPYGAWLVVAKGMREARESGLFGDWTGRTR